MAEPQSPKQGSRPGAMTQAMQAVPGKQSGSKVLRVGLFRDKKIVEERIVRRRETVSIGTAAKNHLIIRSGTLPAKLESRFELFQLVGDDYILNFTSEMSGKIALPGGVQKLEHLRDTGAARNAGTHFQIKLADTSRGNIKIGDFTVFFEFVAAPPITPKPQLPAAVQRGFVKNIDWTFTTWVIFSYMLFFGFIIYMENADWKVDKGSQEVPESLARLVFEAPIEPPTVQEELVEEGEGEEKEEAEGKAPEKQPSKAAGKGPVGAEQAGESAEGRARIAQEAAAQAEAMLLGALGGSGGALGDVLSGVQSPATRRMSWRRRPEWAWPPRARPALCEREAAVAAAERRSRLAEEGPGRRQGRPRRASHPRTRGSRRRRPEQRWRHWRER